MLTRTESSLVYRLRRSAAVGIPGVIAIEVPAE